MLRGLVEETDYQLRFPVAMESHVWEWKGLGSWVPPHPVRYMQVSARKTQPKNHVTGED